MKKSPNVVIQIFLIINTQVKNIAQYFQIANEAFDKILKIFDEMFHKY